MSARGWPRILYWFSLHVSSVRRAVLRCSRCWAVTDIRPVHINMAYREMGKIATYNFHDDVIYRWPFVLKYKKTDFKTHIINMAFCEILQPKIFIETGDKNNCNSF